MLYFIGLAMYYLHTASKHKQSFLYSIWNSNGQTIFINWSSAAKPKKKKKVISLRTTEKHSQITEQKCGSSMWKKEDTALTHVGSLCWFLFLQWWPWQSHVAVSYHMKVHFLILSLNILQLCRMKVKLAHPHELYSFINYAFGTAFSLLISTVY